MPPSLVCRPAVPPGRAANERGLVWLRWPFWLANHRSTGMNPGGGVSVESANVLRRRATSDLRLAALAVLPAAVRAGTYRRAVDRECHDRRGPLAPRKGHKPGGEMFEGVRGTLRVARGLRLCSRELGLFGVADVVEFQRVDMPSPPPEGRSQESEVGSQNVDRLTCPLPGPSPRGRGRGCVLPNVAGRWRPFPVEYKRGKRKAEMSYFVQLRRRCAWRKCSRPKCAKAPTITARAAAGNRSCSTRACAAARS